MATKIKCDDIVWVKVVTAASLIIICLSFVFSSFLREIYYRNEDENNQCFVFVFRNAYLKECVSENGKGVQIP